MQAPRTAAVVRTLLGKPLNGLSFKRNYANRAGFRAGAGARFEV
jgi:hypothetical protein